MDKLIAKIDKKLERFDPIWQAEHGTGGQRTRYYDKTGVAKWREWRGVKDTLYDYTQWLNNLSSMVQMVASAPVSCLKGFWEYRWMGSYLGTFMFIDRLFEGYRGPELVIAHMNMHAIVQSLTKKIALVLYAFEHGEQGDLFVQKAPAATIETLAQAVLELKHSNLGTTIIGTRHGEKLFEVLVTAEEMMRAEELPGFFRIPADNRDLNYDNYFSKGNPEFGKIEQYTSHNTHRLNVEEMKQLLLKLKLFGGTC